MYVVRYSVHMYKHIIDCLENSFTQFHTAEEDGGAGDRRESFDY